MGKNHESERASGYVSSIPFPLTALRQLQWLIPPFPVDQLQAQSVLVVILSCCALYPCFSMSELC